MNNIKKSITSQYQHVVMISLDSLRSDCISGISSGFCGKPLFFKTSAIDRLIKEGTCLRNCISAAPYTSASHAAYFTGCWPRKNGVYEFFNRTLGKPTIFQLAKKENIKTVFQTDFPIILGSSLGFDRGVDHYFIESEEKAFKCVIKNSKEKTISFFHFGGIHYPYGFHKLKFAPKDFPEKVDSLERSLGLKRAKDQADMLDESFRNSRDKDFLLRYKNIIDHLWANKRYDELHRLYGEGIDYFFKHRFNKFIQKVTDFIDKNNGLLILFADHGEEWSAESRGHSNSISDNVLRVPVIFYGKGVKKNVLVTELARTIDVTPTISKYFLAKENHFDGLPIDLASPSALGKRAALAQVWRVGNRSKVYTHQQKILKKGKMIRPLATKLEKEAYYEGEFAITREYSGDKSLVRERLFRNTGRKLVLSPKNKKISVRFGSELQKYNSLKPKKAGRLTKVAESIAEDLQSLGYSV